MSRRRSTLPALAALSALLCGAAGCPARPAARPPTVHELEAAFAAATRDPGAALGIAEAAKCLRIRETLLSVGARPHALPARRTLALPSLSADEALLSFFALRGRYHRFLVRGRTGGASRAQALPALAARQIDPLLVKTRDELELGSLDTPERLWTLLRRGHGALLADVEPHLAGVRRLIVLPDGLLRLVPLHALLAAEASGGEKPVVAARDVSYLPCLGLLHRRRGALGRATFFVAHHGTQDAPLPGGALEAERAAKHLQVTRVRSARAGAAGLARALQRGDAVVHFAGHGLAALDDAGGLADRVPELILDDAGHALSAASATRRRLRAPLVVLASCAAGYAARFRDGQRLIAPTNLVEALLAAGVDSVVAASWSVKDGESAVQLGAFYEQLRALGPGSALARVHRQRLARLRPAHPRFWGAYAVYGDWR